MSLPLIRGSVQKELDKALVQMETDMVDRSRPFVTEIPETGWSSDKVQKELLANEDLKHSSWEDGRVSGAVYHGGRDLIDIQTKAYKMFAVANQLHPDVFPGVRKMEAEVVSMVLKLYNAPESGCGTSTSGGTESLLLTSLAAREKARIERGVTDPEIIAPITVHAGFDKAAYYFKMKLVHAPVDPVTGQVDLKAVRRLVNKNTVLIVGSAPNYPHGVIDDIEGLSKIALRCKIPLHVDACLGSFIVPFLEEVYRGTDVKVPLFDFRVPGVTSISCDTHKYGFAPKGSSIIMYRDRTLRAYQYFVAVDWSGGLYASPTLAGSRPGALMVGCWATLVTIGRQGYLESARSITSAARAIKSAIDADIPDLKVLGNPIASVVAFSSDKVNVYDLSDLMAKKGWHLSTLQNPAALHVACTRLTLQAVDDLVRDLKATVEEMVGLGSKPAGVGTKAVYGVAGSVQTGHIAEDIAKGFLDNLYKV
jgi:sphinganine-1-phosphate aldolase